MVRRVFPDDGDARRIDASGRMSSASGLPAIVYADEAGLVLADLRTYPGGALVLNSILTVGSDSTLPLFHGPDGVDTVFVSVAAGPLTAVHARTDDRLDEMPGSDWLNVRSYGAVGDGVTDDRDAIQAALNDASVISDGSYATVYLPVGRYLLSAPLHITACLRLTGTPGAVLVTTASGIIDFESHYIHPLYLGQVAPLEIDHLTMDATGGHVFAGSGGINQASFHDLHLIQRSSAYGVWNQSGASAGLICATFSRVLATTYSAARSVPTWYIQSEASASVSGVQWISCLTQNLGCDNTQFAFDVGATGSHWYVEQLSWRDCSFESPLGGAIKVRSGHGTIIDGAAFWDCFSTFGTFGTNSLIHIGKDAGSDWPSANTLITDCTRDLNGPNGSTSWDVRLESTCTHTRISGYSARPLVTAGPTYAVDPPRFNLGESSEVQVLGCGSSTPGAGQYPSITSAPTSWTQMGNIGGKPNSLQLSGSLTVGAPSLLTGTGTGILGLDTTIVPTTNPASGIVAYVDGGYLTYRTNAGVVVTLDGGAGTAVDNPNATPGDQNLITWSIDPGSSLSATAIPAAGVVNLTRVILRQERTVTNLLVYVNARGSGLTAGQNLIGLYTAAGTLVGVSADQTSRWGGSDGVLWSAALSGGPYTLAAGFYYAAMLFNGSSSPTFARGNALGAALQNAGLAAAAYRSATNGTGLTALPASMTMSSNGALTPHFFVALN